MNFFNRFFRIFGFKINIKDIIEEEKNNFKIYADEIKENHRIWENKQQLIQANFNNVIKQSKGSVFNLSLHKGLNQIQLSFEKKKIPSSINENSAILENGSALVFSKACSGRVFCALYYANSDEHKPKEDYFIWKSYQRPQDISQNEIDKAISLLFTVQRVYSSLYSYDIFDLCQLWFCKIKSFCSSKRMYLAEKLINKAIQ